MRLLTSHWLARACQLVLGAVFVYASYEKIVEPPDFAKMICGYKMTPNGVVNLMAIYLPWLELLAGAVLIFAAWRFPGRKGAALLVGALLLVFIAAIGFNLYRGHPTPCGCFEVKPRERTPQELFAEMWWVLIRDVGMLFLVAQVLGARFPGAAAGLSDERT